MAIKLKVQDNGPVRLNVAGTDGVRLTAEQGIPIYPNPYIGDYEVYPDETEHTLSANGLMMTDDVTVHAVPSDYVGSAIDRRSADDVSVSGPSVSGPNGYYEELFTKTVQSGSAAVPSLNIEKNPTISVSTGGLITATVSTSETVSPIITEGYIDSGTAGTISFSGSSTQQLTVKTSGDLTASGETVTAPAGFYAESASKSVSNGNIGVPYIVKDAVSNHSVKLTPFYTRTEGWISGSGTYSGTQTTVSASDLVSGTLSITQNTTGQDVTNYAAVDVNVSGDAPNLQTKSVSYTPTTSQQTDTVTANAGYDGLDEVDVTIGAVSTGSVSTPATTITANPTITVNTANGLITATASSSKSVTPTVSTGWVSSGTSGTITVSGSNTSQLTTVNGTTITPTTSEQTAVSANRYTLGAVKVAAMPSGTAGTPSASKGTVTNHAIIVTPTVTNSTGYINGGTKTGTGVTVSASELVSGSETKTSNGTYDVTNLAQLIVNVSGGGGGGIGDLLATKAIGAYSTAVTSATNMNVSVAATNINAYDVLLVETSVDTNVANRHMATVGAAFIVNSTNAATKNAAVMANAKWNAKLSSSSVTQTTSSTTAYGIYPNSCTVTTTSNGTATFAMYARYHSSRSGTINGTYTARVYGIKLCDLIGG